MHYFAQIKQHCFLVKFFFKGSLMDALPCTFLELDMDSSVAIVVANVPDASSCHEVCLEHPDCQFFLWVTPVFEIAAQANECWLKWGTLTNKKPKAGVLSNDRICSIGKEGFFSTQ